MFEVGHEKREALPERPRPGGPIAARNAVRRRLCFREKIGKGRSSDPAIGIVGRARGKSFPLHARLHARPGATARAAPEGAAGVKYLLDTDGCLELIPRTPPRLIARLTES